MFLSPDLHTVVSHVRRYRTAGIESEVPGFENTNAQRERLIRYIARKWLLEELHFRDRVEFGIIAGSRASVPSVPRVLVQAVSCGLRHTACISAKGEVFTFGLDQRGALGRPIMPPLLADSTLPKELNEEEAAALLKAKAKVRMYLFWMLISGA